MSCVSVSYGNCCWGRMTERNGPWDNFPYMFFPQGPHSHILMTGGPKDFLGSDISAKRDFFGSMKDAEIFLGRENNTGIFWGIVFFISSNQQ